MSLIETALNRARGQAEALPDSRRAARRVIRRSTAAVADAPAGRTYTPATINAEVMEQFGVLRDVPDDLALRSYKILRTRILQRMEAQQWHSVAVTSAAPGDGKTLTAINMAIALAQEPGTSVFLVDLDLQRPTIARYLGMNHGPGLSQYLAGEATPEQIVYDIGIERLAVVPNGQALHGSSELLSSTRMGELIRFLEGDGPRRIIVFDMPPALVGDDVMVFSEYVDSVLLVVAEGQTTRTAVENTRNVLADMNLIGVVLNRSVQNKDAAYSYY
jgi:capsular exopolysaccharide synthesis family protein